MVLSEGARNGPRVAHSCLFCGGLPRRCGFIDMRESHSLRCGGILVIATIIAASAWAGPNHGSGPEGDSRPTTRAASASEHSPLRGTSPQPTATGNSQPAPNSLFDVLGKQLAPVPVTVEVREPVQDLNTSEPRAFQSGGAEIVSSAGTFGDISRFLQLSPGVVTSSDMSNEMFVRGGHPMENLFLVDGIEVPNINSLATLGTTGGFGPMMDSGIVQRVALFTGGYDARFPDRLSSITEITTLDDSERIGRLEGDLGIQGFGGIADRRMGGGDLLISAHHGIINALGGGFGSQLPTYTNEFARFRRSFASGSSLTFVDLGGQDAVKVMPCFDDVDETGTIASQYSGWRNTAGAEWQQVYSPKSFGVLNVSDSEEVEDIHQQDLMMDHLHPDYVTGGSCPLPAGTVPSTPVYLDHSNDAFTTAGYRFGHDTRRFTLEGGSGFWSKRPHYSIAQPEGILSPYSVTPNRDDSTSFSSVFSTTETGTFAQIGVRPVAALTLSGGGRFETFAFGNHQAFTPRASARYAITSNVAIHAAYAAYAQLPPYVYIVSFPENRSMGLMRATHEIAGLELTQARRFAIELQAFKKQYHGVPASTEYPSVNLHDMVNLVGSQIVWLPMNSAGHGSSSGIELSDISHFGRLDLRASLAYSRAKFAGRDNVLRPSSYDFPWVLNLAANHRLNHGYELATRYTYATGRPYTPFDMPNSLTENRPIYDVARMNGVRAPYYSRLDLQLNKDIAFSDNQHIEIYTGAENVFNRQNYLAYLWKPLQQALGSPNRVYTMYQTPIFPNFGVRYLFH